MITNVVLSDRPLYTLYYYMLNYIGDDLSPLRIAWKSIEGFWPGFQLRAQEEVPDNIVLAPDDIAIVARPQSVEIDERTNWPWRMYRTIPMSSSLGLPFFDSNDLKIWLHFLRVHGTFEITVQSHSPVFAHDIIINMLARWNNRYVDIGFLEFPLLVPIRLIEQEKPTWRDILLQSPKLSHAYLGITGEEHYYFTLQFKPLVKLSSAPSYSIAGDQLYEVSFPFEYMASIPVSMVWSDVGKISYVWYSVKYDQTSTLPLLAGALALNADLGFRPTGWAYITSTPAILLIWAPTTELAFAVWDANENRPLEANISVKTSDIFPTRLEVTLDILTPGYEDLSSKTVLLFWGPRQ